MKKNLTKVRTAMAAIGLAILATLTLWAGTASAQPIKFEVLELNTEMQRIHDCFELLWDEQGPNLNPFDDDEGDDQHAPDIHTWLASDCFQRSGFPTTP